jgi:hypothetical protein
MGYDDVNHTDAHEFVPTARARASEALSAQLRPCTLGEMKPATVLTFDYPSDHRHILLAETHEAYERRGLASRDVMFTFATSEKGEGSAGFGSNKRVRLGGRVTCYCGRSTAQMHYRKRL